MMIEASAAELPMTILSLLAPTLLEPVPSMAVAEFRGGSEVHNVPRGARLDCRVNDQSLLCFRTTMDVAVAPVTLTTRRLKAREGCADGIAIEFRGTPPREMKLYLGSDELSAAALVDGLSKDLRAVEVVAPGVEGAHRAEPELPDAARIQTGRGGASASPGHAARAPAGHGVHVFPGEIPVRVDLGCPSDKRHRDPVLVHETAEDRHGGPAGARECEPGSCGSICGRTSATPFDVTGKQLEYAVRVDALRYRRPGVPFGRVRGNVRSRRGTGQAARPAARHGAISAEAPSSGARAAAFRGPVRR